MFFNRRLLCPTLFSCSLNRMRLPIGSMNSSPLILSGVSGEWVLGREFREVVVANYVHFISVVTHQTSQVFETRTTLRIVSGTLGGE